MVKLLWLNCKLYRILTCRRYTHEYTFIIDLNLPWQKRVEPHVKQIASKYTQANQQKSYLIRLFLHFWARSAANLNKYPLSFPQIFSVADRFFRNMVHYLMMATICIQPFIFQTAFYFANRFLECSITGKSIIRLIKSILSKISSKACVFIPNVIKGMRFFINKKWKKADIVEFLNFITGITLQI